MVEELDKMNSKLQHALDVIDLAIIIKQQKKEIKWLKSIIASKDIQLTAMMNPEIFNKVSDYEYENILINKIENLMMKPEINK